MFKRFAFAVLVVLGFTAVSAARDLTAEESDALKAGVEAHEALMHAKDAGGVIDDFPPAVLPFIAQMMQVDEDTARQQGINTMMTAAEGAPFDAYDIDFDAAPPPYELADGTTYVLLPTKMIDLPGDGTVLKDEVTVAVLLEGEWYLIGFDTNEESQLLIAAYPGFADPGFVTNLAAALAQ